MKNENKIRGTAENSSGVEKLLNHHGPWPMEGVGLRYIPLVSGLPDREEISSIVPYARTSCETEWSISESSDTKALEEKVRSALLYKTSGAEKKHKRLRNTVMAGAFVFGMSLSALLSFFSINLVKPSLLTPNPSYEKREEILPSSDSAYFLEEKGVSSTEAVAEKPADEASPYSPAETQKILSAGVPVLMYHKIKDIPGYDRYNVKPEEFRQQLQRLYEKNFTLISLEELLNEDLSSVPVGRKPAVITFDDSTKGQFSYIEEGGRVKLDEGGNPVLDPDCAFAIMKDFYERSPDFGFEATFFVDFSKNGGEDDAVPFGQKGYEGLKINRLVKEGLTVGNHTYNHISMRQAGRQEIEKELGKVMEELEKYLGEDVSQVGLVAYPYGALPNDFGREAPSVTYHGKEYRFVAAMHAWGGCAFPSSNTYKIPRIETNRVTFDGYVLHKGIGSAELKRMKEARETYNEEISDYGELDEEVGFQYQADD